MPEQRPCHVQAAVYGRAFCSVNTVPPDLLLRAAVRLRILNSLQDPGVGVPLTDAQLTALSPAVLVDRLANSRRHLLALRMAAALDLPTNKVSDFGLISGRTTPPPRPPSSHIHHHHGCRSATCQPIRSAQAELPSAPSPS